MVIYLDSILHQGEIHGKVGGAHSLYLNHSTVSNERVYRYDDLLSSPSSRHKPHTDIAPPDDHP